LTYQPLTEPPRHGDWMQTYTGRQFWPLDARADEVDIVDIAHALSQTCRYGGHCEQFYSVAEHSVLCSLVVPAEHALQALLHDATEAYLVDVPRPIKRFLGNYEQIEQALAFVIGQHFGVELEHLDPSVKAADNAVLLAEADEIMKPHPAPWCIPGEPAEVSIHCYQPRDAEALFLARYQELTRG